ncbi:branched-chain amino acid aminotransferase [Thermosipho japonicus]|uniref:Branched-chain amino acid aminotransferase n=1 Tax=Thermosipho japonicus TaxID=90323 RepID=A0A841GNU4_9BACT|nr:aminotransferase class IV [Thermosipho japonicus]MBB6062844.1 branched-chain amino acid aminotransferase [Thermosipho japonicus]
MNERSLIDKILNGIVVYETVRIYDGKPFAIREHYKRLINSLSYLGREDEVSLDDFEKEIERNISFDRVKVYAIVSDKVELYSVGENILTKRVESVKIDISNVRHADPSSIPPNFKSLSRADVFLARQNKGDNYDVILLGQKGQVCEGSFSNVFLVKDGKLITPSLESGILEGITRTFVIDMLKENGYTVEEKIVEVKELFYADEIFLTHTSMGIVPVNYLGKFSLKTELSEKLSMMFEEYLHAKIG